LLGSGNTKFPRIRLAASHLLDKLKNDITRETPATFEPRIDYLVTKVARFAFEKFPQADPTLTTQMKSVGEAMAISRTFQEPSKNACACQGFASPGLRASSNGRPRTFQGSRRVVLLFPGETAGMGRALNMLCSQKWLYQ
jgi:carbamoylphosphate synthase large subunit